MKGGVVMKKLICLILTICSLILLCSCKVNWFTETYEVPWYYVVIPCVVLVVLAYVILCSKTYICPDCKTEFKPKWYHFFIAFHSFGKRVAKCPNCKKINYCEVKKNK